MSTEELLAEVLRLPRAERARLAEQLLSSLEDPTDEVALSWADELIRRSGKLADRRLQSVSWDTVKAEIREELDQQRAGRSSS